ESAVQGRIKHFLLFFRSSLQPDTGEKLLPGISSRFSDGSKILLTNFLFQVFFCIGGTYIGKTNFQFNDWLLVIVQYQESLSIPGVFTQFFQSKTGIETGIKIYLLATHILYS